jgi:hypothetical protein
LCKSNRVFLFFLVDKADFGVKLNALLHKGHTMNEALAHFKQLLALGCDYVQAVTDTVVAFEVCQFELQAAYHCK